jgi:hypothetical protein
MLSKYIDIYMAPEFDKYLCEKYPKIFKNRDGSIMETCMAWGFECGDGWFNVIDALCKEIQHHIDWKYKDLPVDEREAIQVVADQVKEKYGTLRFYYHGGDEVIEGMVSMAESMTHRTCEVCGNSGQLRAGGWYRTLCNTCEANRNSTLKGEVS